MRVALVYKKESESVAERVRKFLERVSDVAVFLHQPPNSRTSTFW